jgi:hypothetical protein
MPSRRQVILQPAQEHELRWALKNHAKAYVRERAAAILKVAAGTPMRQVAAGGLLQTRTEEALSDWIDRYESEGLSGLVVRKGRGRKPAFSPCGGAH